jgi:hypothetical protein
MHVVLRHYRAYEGYLEHLMPLRLRVITVQRLLATGARRGLERDDLVDLCHRHQRPGLATVPGLPTRPTPTGETATALTLAGGRITRRRPRGGARVLMQLLQQSLHGCLQRRHTGFEVQDIGLSLRRCALPDLGWPRRFRIHDAIVRCRDLSWQISFDYLNGYL